MVSRNYPLPPHAFYVWPPAVADPGDPSGDGNGGGQCCADSSSSDRPPPDSSWSAQPVRYNNLAIQGFGFPWGHTRSYSNQLTDQADGTNGNSWRVKEWPYVVEFTDSSSSGVCVVNGTIYDALWFDLQSGNYAPRFYVQDTLTHDTVAHEYIHTDTSGSIKLLCSTSSTILQIASCCIVGRF